ncbi:hypothetical protein [Empedobacter tilapiae]|uniref:Peptide zinc metalloprotease protein n=2 Tax=Empedobacter tilapiae TaxID=2491114 RepID=A0A4Z1B3M7_9FLAO|nr:hypothetical protein [Empedobacter tilapiae]TGN22214.1 hypothetical protein E4J94_16200 [Empedobacter tilapiae]
MKSEMLNTMTDINFSFTKKNDQNWILEHSEKFFIVSDEIKSLLELLKKNQFNLDESYKDFILEFDYVSTEDFNHIVKDNLETLELNQTNNDKSIKKKSFILFETKLISKENAAKISKIFQPLFQPTFFWIAFTLLFSFSIYNLTQIHHFHLEKEYMLFLFIFYIFSAFIHEFGHIAACNRFTKRSGEIGIGIYFIFPVFYSNITPIWSAKKQERIITNLAGVYVQLFIILGLFITYLFTANHQIQDVIAISTIIILYQLIPFIRSDGYWIISDLTDTPNLLPSSSKKVKEFLKNPFKFKVQNRKDWLILLYGLFNQIIMIYVIISIIRAYRYQLIAGPIELIKTIFNQPTETLTYLTSNIELMIISIVFYMILFNLIKRLLKI